MTKLTRYRPNKPVVHDTQKTYPRPVAMAEPGVFIATSKEGTGSGIIGSSEKEPYMKGGVSCIAFGFGLLTETLLALGQTTSPTFVAQGPSSAPPSGVLMLPPAAPVLVPPSGVLPTVERHVVTARPLKAAKQIHIAKRSLPVGMHRHVVNSHPASRRHTITRPTTVAQNKAPTLSVVSAAAEEPRHDGISYDSFLSQLGKAKEAK